MYKGTPNPPVKPSEPENWTGLFILEGSGGPRHGPVRWYSYQGAPRYPGVPRVLPLLGLLLLIALLLSGAIYVGGRNAPPAAAPSSLAARSQIASPPSGSWPTFRGGPSRTGFTSSSGPTSPIWAWVVPFSRYTGFSGGHLRSSAAVNGSEVIAADDLGNVLALNTSDNGSLLWKSSVGFIPTGPTIDGNIVLIGDANGGLTALNARTGTHLWTRNLGAPINQSVLVENSTGVAVTRAGSVVAFSPATGATLWSTAVAGIVDGAPAFDGTYVYITTEAGNVTALNVTTGAAAWNTSLKTPVATGAVTVDGEVLVAGSAAHGQLYALRATDGHVLWNWSDAGLTGGGGGYLASPAADATTAYLIGNLGGIFAVWLSNGTTRWNSTPAAGVIDEGYPLTAPPVITPYALYLIDGLEEVDNFNPVTGALRWSTAIGTTSYTPPAVVGDALTYGDDDGNLYWVAPTVAITWPVTGRVVATNGTPIPGAGLDIPSVATATTNGNGDFSMQVPNGTYTVTVSAVGYYTIYPTVTVAGPTSNLTYTLALVPLYPIHGTVIDGGSARGLGGVTVSLIGITYYVATTAVTTANGSFTILGPPGSDYLAAAPPSGYAGTYQVVSVPVGGTHGIFLSLAPLGLISAPPPWPGSLTAPMGSALIPLAAIGVGFIACFFWGVSYSRARRGLSPQVLSPFGRRIAMRLLLVPIQAVILLAILFIFGGMFIAAARFPTNVCVVSAGACKSVLGVATCGWNSATCVTVAFFGGWWQYIVRIFIGQWGYDAFGNNVQTVTTLLSWYLPPSIELAIFALTISAIIAYPIGLLAGWWADRPFDQGVRISSLVGLLLPTFLVILLILLAFYTPFTNAIGDTPYGITPNVTWYSTHGGQPSWIGPAGNTLPTGFPLVDAVIHGDWPFARVVLAKTLLQAFIIALVYTAIYLRYARAVVAERARSLPIVAARSRGVTERSLLWRHTAREVLPVLFLLVGITFPIYIGTQAITESLFNDTGIGRVLLAEITNEQSTGFGISTLQSATGNLYQVTIFLLFFVVMIASITSDAIAQWLDPRLSRGEGS